MMKLYESRCEFTSFLLIAGFFYLAEVIDAANEFRKCYNTSMEMHCLDLQYDTTNNTWLTASFDNARQRCNHLGSTLLIIKDDETNSIVQDYISESSPYPIRNPYIWMDAYRINNYNNSYPWNWLNSKLPNKSLSELSTPDYSWYVAALEFDNGKSQFHITAQQPHIPNFANSYVCEYAESNCSSASSSDERIMNGRCYRSVQGSISWYEARNRCLKDGGDLASFANVTGANFTSWLGTNTSIRFWIGLRFSWYIWKDSGEDVKFSKWIANFGDWVSPCLVLCSNCTPSFSWFPKDCSMADSIYVVCHSVTSLQVTTFTTTLTASITTQAVHTSSDNREPNDKHIALGVGVGVGVGLAVIVAIVVIVICVVRRHQFKTPAASKATRQYQREEPSPTEAQTGNNEFSEINHYATIPRLSPPSSHGKDPTSEAQYAILDFEESARRKNGNEESSQSVL